MATHITLILGATGRVGRLIVPRLLTRGQSVRALVRDMDAAREVLGKEVALVQGDLRDRKAQAEAIYGCNTFIFAAGALGGFGRGTPREIECDAVASLVGLPASATIERFVLLSSAGVTQPEHPHNCTRNSMLKWKLRGEQALRESGIPYTIVRALGLRDRPGGDRGVRIVQSDRIAFGEDISREDVAAFLADIVAPSAFEDLQGFDRTSFASATCEIFNDHNLSAGLWDSRLGPLQRDPLASAVGARP